jgi:hypothetical protein
LRSCGHFERSLLSPASLFYQHELRKISRPTSAGWARADCPFHSSTTHKSLAVNLRHGGYHCFGCGRHGDMIAFVRERYHMGFREASRALGAWTTGGMRSIVFERHEDEERERERRERIESSRRLRGLYEVWEVVNGNFENEDVYYEFMNDLADEIREAEFDYDRRLDSEWSASRIRSRE